MSASVYLQRRFALPALLLGLIGCAQAEMPPTPSMVELESSLDSVQTTIAVLQDSLFLVTASHREALEYRLPALRQAEDSLFAEIGEAAAGELYAEVTRIDAQGPAPDDTASVGAPDTVLVPVYFATSRERAAPSGNVVRFLNRESRPPRLQYGRADVVIPASLRPGQSDGRGWCRYLPGPLACKRNASNSIQQRMVQLLDSSEYEVQLDTLLSSDRGADVLVFVHGFNVDFQGAIMAAAHLAYDIGFEGVVTTFDWASYHSVPSYLADEKLAERSAPLFREFLDRLRGIGRIRRLIVVAHSMGTRVVSYGLRETTTSLLPLRQGMIVFAASDMDSLTFVRDYSPHLRRHTAFATLYASARDRAISLSKGIHQDARVGSGPPSVVIVDDFDYVDASSQSTDLLGHGYFSSNEKLIQDIFYLTRLGIRATDRYLEKVPHASAQYFRFR